MGENQVENITMSDGITYPCRQGEPLLEVLIRNGVYIDAPCAGKGRCGKCKVRLTGVLPPPTPQEEELLGNLVNDGWRLACQVKAAESYRVQVQQNQPVLVQTEGIGLYQYKLDCRCGRPWNEQVEQPVGMAVDIGTTTLAVYFYHMADGALLWSGSALNPQRSFGADVISRIGAVRENPKNLPLMQQAVIRLLNQLIAQFTSYKNIIPINIIKVYLTGNTTMLHLAAGEDPSGMATSPFVPRFTKRLMLQAKQLGLNVNPGAEVTLVESIAAFVGGDIVSGMVAAGMQQRDDACLLIDVGTNGEMAVGSRQGILCCATAAGPAFEGAHLEYGVGSVPGAICKVRVQDGKVTTETIGGQPPVGICGSGIVDCIAQLLDAGIIDGTGRLLDVHETPPEYAKYRTNEMFLLDPAAGIGITAKDVREIQLAKAAVSAGIKCLLKEAGLNNDQLARVYVAGGFGAHIDLDSACRIGLFPVDLRTKLFPVGNGAGVGCGQMLLSEEARQAAAQIKAISRYIELSGSKQFEEFYFDQLLFKEE